MDLTSAQAMTKPFACVLRGALSQEDFLWMAGLNQAQGRISKPILNSSAHPVRPVRYTRRCTAPSSRHTMASLLCSASTSAISTRRSAFAGSRVTASRGEPASGLFGALVSRVYSVCKQANAACCQVFWCGCQLMALCIARAGGQHGHSRWPHISLPVGTLWVAAPGCSASWPLLAPVWSSLSKDQAETYLLLISGYLAPLQLSARDSSSHLKLHQA